MSVDLEKRVETLPEVIPESLPRDLVQAVDEALAGSDYFANRVRDLQERLGIKIDESGLRQATVLQIATLYQDYPELADSYAPATILGRFDSGGVGYKDRQSFELTQRLYNGWEPGVDYFFATLYDISTLEPIDSVAVFIPEKKPSA